MATCPMSPALASRAATQDCARRGGLGSRGGRSAGADRRACWRTWERGRRDCPRVRRSVALLQFGANEISRPAREGLVARAIPSARASAGAAAVGSRRACRGERQRDACDRDRRGDRAERGARVRAGDAGRASDRGLEGAAAGPRSGAQGRRGAGRDRRRSWSLAMWFCWRRATGCRPTRGSPRARSR